MTGGVADAPHGMKHSESHKIGADVGGPNECMCVRVNVHAILHQTKDDADCKGTAIHTVLGPGNVVDREVILAVRVPAIEFADAFVVLVAPPVIPVVEVAIKAATADNVDSIGWIVKECHKEM